jgi:O-antigen/teichoic acid export membrane protein
MSEANAQGAIGPGDRATRLTKQVARGGGITLSGQALSKGLTFFLQLLLSNVLGAQGYGLYSLGVNVIEWLQQISQCGLATGVIRFVAADNARGRVERVKGTILGALSTGGIVSLLCALATWIWAGPISTVFFRDPVLAPYLRGMLVGLPFMALLLIGQAILRGLNRIGDMAVVGIWRAFLHLGFAVAAFAVGWEIWGAVAAMVLSASLALLWAIHRIRRAQPRILDGPVFELRPLLRFSLPVWVAGLSAMLLSRLDLVMIGHFMESTSVGHYRAAATVASLVAYALVVFNTSFAPMISELFERGHREELAHLYRTVTRWSFIAALLAFIVILFHAHSILGLFGTGFSAGTWALVLLATGQLINAAVGSVGFMIQMTARQDWFLANNLIAGALNVALNLWLIPQWGILGAAVATSSSVALNNLLGVAEVWSFHRLQPWGRGYLPVLAAGAVATGVELLLSRLIPLWPLTLAVACAAYGGTIFLWGLDPDDRMILHALKRRLAGRGDT